MPRVSVVIPLYNKADHIGRAIDSVFAQGFDDLEIVVVDDESTDDSLSIVQAYYDRRIRLIRQDNAGPGTARNRAIREARGEWIAPLDADDYWLPGFLDCVLRRAEVNPECDAVTTFWIIDDNDPDSVSRRFLDRGGPVGPYRLAEDADPQTVRALMARFGCRNTLVRKQAVLDVGGFHEVSRNGEDLYLWLKLLLTCRVCFGDEVLAYRDRGASELSVGAWRRGEIPLPRPYVTDPDPIRSVCPPEYEALLDRLFDALARREAWHQVQAGRIDVAQELITKYPNVTAGWGDRMRFWFWMRAGRVHDGRPIGEWGPLARTAYRSCKWLRVKSPPI